MSYYFFLSYAHDNNSPYLQEFFQDLSKDIREKKRLQGPTEEVGFFDQRDLELGSEWDPTLRDALQESKVLVSVYTPPYFQSENCGREWQVFQMRREQFVKEATERGDQKPRLPPVIKPVLWIPLRDDLPEIAKGPQYIMGDPNAEQNQAGFNIVTKLKDSRFKEEYVVFIDQLSNQILDAAEYDLPKADLGDYPTFESVPNAFDPEPVEDTASPSVAISPGSGLVASNPRALGPNFVQFVFVAGSPSEFLHEALDAQKAHFRKQVEFYVNNGGSDWKPFLPDIKRRIRPMVTNIASGEGLDFDSDELPCDEQLTTKIHQANTERSLVIILVDSWTLDLKKYREVLEGFDRNLYSNCSVLIPWNEKDPELTGDQRARLERNVRDTFRNWSSVTKPLYFCYSIRSPGELKSRIRETLKALRDSVINATVNDPSLEVARPVESTITKPNISSKPIEETAGGPN
jgi:FxsC-like protein